jgi:hypothetical protein
VGFGDSRVQNNATLRSLWLNETARPRYLQQSPTLFTSLGYPPPGSLGASSG